MDNNKDKFILQKIPIEKLLNILQYLYDSGADYVDIVGHPDDEKDTIGLVTRSEYYFTKEDTENDEQSISLNENLDIGSNEDINEIIA